MLSAVVKLVDIVPEHPGEIEVRVSCRSCGNRLGDYLFGGVLHIDDGGNRHTVNPFPTNYVRKGRKSSPRGAAAFDGEIYHSGGPERLHWKCGCGAHIQRRANRFEGLEVLYVKDRPTVYI